MTYPLVRDLAAEGFPVRLTYGVFGFSTQAFFAWSKNPVSLRDLEDAYAINALNDAPGGCVPSRSCGPRPSRRAEKANDLAQR